MNNNPLKHLAIIMDGNGRWATSKGYARTVGHEKGSEVIRDISIYCSHHQEIESVTFYAFSTENWKRPKYEVDFLMKLLERYLQKELPTYQEYNIKFKAIGNLEEFSKSLQEKIKYIEEQTKNNTALTQVMALNYGARYEITDAVNRCIKDGKTDITQEDISNYLQTPYSDIDLLIRTSGEQRVSNFLLWQLSYSELYFTDTLWPDFTHQELESIIYQYKQRVRKFGGLK
jgi:undecaprenyl diphosphate synthase